MRCPFCGYEESKVIDSRPTDENERIRRRRECLRCSKRFTTYEVIEDVPIIVIKKDKSREVFDRNKILKGMLRACEKRSVTINELETAISEIEATLQSAIDREGSRKVLPSSQRFLVLLLSMTLRRNVKLSLQIRKQENPRLTLFHTDPVSRSQTDRSLKQVMNLQKVA